MGERLRPYTLKRGKPAIAFLNLPMLAFPYLWMRPLGLRELTFNTHYLPESIRHAALEIVDPSITVHFPHEDPILNSGGGIWNSRFHLMDQGVFGVANGDGVVTFENPGTLREMLSFHRQHDPLATMLLCPLKDVGTRLPGVWIRPETGEVVSFGFREAVEKVVSTTNLRCLHYASYIFASQRLWKYLPVGPSNILYDVFMTAMAAGEKIMSFRVDNMSWYETGNASEYLAATSACLEAIKSQNAHGQGLLSLMNDPHAPTFASRSQLERRLLIADSAEIDPSVDFEGFSVVGSDCKIEAGARIENSVILPGAVIGASEHVRGELRD
jgi:NDP-sugar pyrophosphorylase family protein